MKRTKYYLKIRIKKNGKNALIQLKINLVVSTGLFHKPKENYYDK